jgi:lipopolysaccharide export system permease protein
VLQLLPFVFLFGVMAAFVALNRRSELVAMRAAGLSAWGMILPAAAAAFLIGLISVAALNPLAATLNSRFDALRNAVTSDRSPGAGKEVWLREVNGGTQLVIRAESRDSLGGAIRLNGVSFFIQGVGGAGGSDVSRRIEADRALLAPGYWRLSGVREFEAGAESVRSESLSLPSTLDRRMAMEAFVPPGAVAFWALPATIRSAESAGYSASTYQMRFQQLLATPLLLAAMTMLAAAFSLRLIRLGDLAAFAAAGVGLGFIVFFVNQFCGALGATGVIPVGVAAWCPPLFSLLSALTVLCHTEDG